MTPADFRVTLAALGIAQARLARLLDLNPSTVQRWATGELPVPRSAVLLLRLMADGKADVAALESL